MTDLLETLFPTLGDLAAGAIWLSFAGALVWGTIDGARSRGLIDEHEPEKLPDPEPSRWRPSNALRVVPAPVDTDEEL